MWIATPQGEEFKLKTKRDLLGEENILHIGWKYKLNKQNMTKETLAQALYIAGRIRSLEGLLQELRCGAAISIGGVNSNRLLGPNREDVINILIPGMEKKIKELEEEFKNL